MKNSKKQTSKFKTLARLATHGKVKFFLRTRRRRILENQLKKFWQQLIKKGSINQILLNFIHDIEDNDKKITTWRDILKRDDFTPNNLYEISAAIDDELLKNETRRKYVAIASDDELVETIKYEKEVFGEMAWGELCERIQKGRIKKGRARQILFKVFEDIPEYRVKSFDVLKWLESTDKELQHLLDFPFMDSLPDLRGKIERLIRKRPKPKDYNIKLISQIQKITERIKKLKEGQ